MNQDREQALLKELDRFTLIVSVGVIVVLVVSYFVVSSATDWPEPVRGFLLALIVNLIPVLLVFVISFLLFRRIQDIRSKRQTSLLAEQISDFLLTELSASTLLAEEENSHHPISHLLVQSDDDEGKLFLRDRSGLPRPISDERTAAYLMHILGYEPDDIIRLPLAELRPVGPEVTGIKDWRPPRTLEDEMSYEASIALKFLGKETESATEGECILRFGLRNDGTDSIYIRAATLSVEPNAPLSIGDVAPKNRPVSRGLLQCTLLFPSHNESARIPPGTTTHLKLYLETHVSEQAATSLTRRGIGYIAVKGEFRGTQVYFHIRGV